MEHQGRPRYLVGEAGPTGLPSGASLARAHQLRRPAVYRGFPEREPRWEAAAPAAAHRRASGHPPARGHL